MARAIATCQHEIKRISYAIEFDDVDRKGEKCISCIVVCPKCYRWYRRKFNLLSVERMKW